MFAKDVFSTAYLALYTAKRKVLAGLADGVGDALLSVAILSSAVHGTLPRFAAILGLVAGSTAGTLVGDRLGRKLDACTS